jgi:AraC-like DNA-binding protein
LGGFEAVQLRLGVRRVNLSVTSHPGPNLDKQSSLTHAAQSIPVTDFDTFRMVFAGWQGRIEQVSAGDFEGTIQVVSGRIVRVVAATGNQRLRVVGRDASEATAIYPLNASLSAGTWSGQRHRAGDIYVGSSKDGIDLCSDRRFAGGVAFLTPEILKDAVHCLSGPETVSTCGATGVQSPAPQEFAEVERRMTRLLELGLTNSALLASAEGHRAEQECLRALVAAIAPPARPKVRLSGQARVQLIRRSEEFLRNSLAAPIGMIDLCREVGVNDRTLRLAFQKHYGVGPMTYFRFLRLNAVRAKLKSDPSVLIADAARECGFNHLGNFAADYRRLFGRLPSQTERG